MLMHPLFTSVTPEVLFSKEFREALESIWALRFIIPDPGNLNKKND